MFARPSLAQLLVPNLGTSPSKFSPSVEPTSIATSTNNEEPNDDSDESMLVSRLIQIPRERFRKLFSSSKKDVPRAPNLPFVQAMLMAGRARDAGVRTVLRLRQKPPLCFLIVNRAYHEYGLKHLVLIMIFMFYVLFGAFVFLIIEKDAQNEMKEAWEEKIRLNRSHVVDVMMKEVFNNSEFLIYIKGNTSMKLKTHFDSVFERYEEKLEIRWSEQRMEWDYWNAILFAGTICTTIGYSHIYPMTTPGRVITMIYALVGIPLMLLVLQDVGKLLTIAMKFPWFQFKRVGRRVLRCCTKQSIKEMRRIETEERRDLEVFDLPLPVAVALIMIWIWLCTTILSMLDEKWTPFEAFYFFFISLSTVGLGDLLPSDPKLLIMLFGFILVGLSLVSMVLNLLQSKMRTTYEAGRGVIEIVETTKEATTLGVLQVFEEKKSHYLVIPDEMQSSTHSRQTQTSLSLPGMRQENQPGVSKVCVLRSDGVHWVEDTTPVKSPDEVTKLVELESSLHVCKDIGENNGENEDFDNTYSLGSNQSFRGRFPNDGNGLIIENRKRREESPSDDDEGTAHHSMPSPYGPNGLILELSNEDLHSPHAKCLMSPESIPFSEIRTKGLHSPLQMQCGVAICMNCSDEKRIHHCAIGLDCKGVFEGSRFYLHLFYNGFLTKTASGYTMAKMFSAPECCNCSKKFQLNNMKRNPIILRCGHLLCVGCLRNSRYATESDEVVCPTCKKHSIMANEIQFNQLKYFLDELRDIQKHFRRTHRWSFFKSWHKSKIPLDESKGKNVDEHDYGKIPAYPCQPKSLERKQREEFALEKSSLEAHFEKIYV
ncbi:unnamed protein product, partial [Mesorhabditis belari]|uniref:RING-type domain-containing protein n=1 Tax=Mesorhabditis belari TaxID=2138241 RepID=A0AAF3JC51_9BILA